MEVVDALKDIQLVLTDIDGTLTDGSLFYTGYGEHIKQFDVRDGMGVTLLTAVGIHVGVVSGRDSEAVWRRTADLKIGLRRFGVRDKAEACEDLAVQVRIPLANTLFLGDDVNDLPAFRVCGMSAVVADAPDYVKQQAEVSIVLTRPGGRGAFRELADMILWHQDKDPVTIARSLFG